MSERSSEEAGMKRFFWAIFMFFFCTAICWGQNSGSAIQFDGVNDYIAIPESLIQSTDHTYSVEVWINVNVLSNAWNGIVHHSAVGGEFIIEIDPDNNFEFGVHTPTGGGFGTWYKIQSPATVNQWYHIVGVRENSVVRLYVDGVLADTMAITDDDQFVLSNYHSCIGAYNQEGNYLNGQVDEVRFWNIALTQLQIQNNMTNLLTGTEEGLAAYWRFDEGSGTISTDLTTNGYIGTLTNDPAWVASTAPLVYDTPPAPPTGLNATAGDQQVTLSWGKNSEIDFLRYFIYGGTSENPTMKIDSTSGGILDTVKTITNLVNGTTYYFRITAVDSAGNESDFSNEVSAKPVRCLFTEQTGINLAGAYYGSVDWGDYDNDGDLDILLTGTNDANLMTKIYTNNGDNSFSEKTDLNLPQVYTGTAVWGDYDNDGDLDILITGNDGNWPVASIYQNNGDGSFDLKPATGLSGVTNSSAAWGDYDNDGDLDILLSGYRYDVEFPPLPCAYVYRNDGNATFSRQYYFNYVASGQVTWSDYDNDGDLDVLLTGWNGSEYITKIYCNNSDNTFSERTDMGLIQAGDGAIDWGDYDNDGDLDILITGNEGDFITAKVYSNDGNGSFTEQTEISLQSVYYSSVAWGDYDNDGDLDILLTGSTGAASGSFWVTKIYNNNGNNSFSELSDITFTGICYSSVAWGDYDNDSDLDILISGLSESGPVSKIYRNNNSTPNTLPAAPTGLAAVAQGDSVVLSWSKTTDDETPPDGLTYNIYVGTSPDSEQVKASMSDNTTGYRRITQMGNTHQCNFHTLKGLAEDTYYWSVQAIDNSFAGSAWAGVSSFIIDLPPVAPQNLTATPGDRQVTLCWRANTENDILCYRIYGGLTANPKTLIDSTSNGVPDTAITITNLVNNTTYYFRITALDVTGNESDFSNEVNIKPGSSLYTYSSLLGTYLAVYNILPGDFDNDGDLDLLMAVQANTSSSAIKIFRNDEGNFIDIEAIFFNYCHLGQASWADYDNDGDLDIVAMGSLSKDNRSGQVTKLYRNDNGSFTDMHATLESICHGSFSWADYDNDGDLDLLTNGYKYYSNWNTHFYQNHDGILIEVNLGLLNIMIGSTDWGDYDNDGDLDILLCGYYQYDNPTYYMKSIIYRNDNGTFTNIDAGLTNVMGWGAGHWGDYDNDGDLDVLLTGKATDNGRASKVFRNDNGVFTDINASLLNVGKFSHSQWGDYDNDGDLDIMISGDITDDTASTWIFENNNGAFSVSDSSLPGGYTSAWISLGNDAPPAIIVHDNVSGRLCLYKSKSNLTNTLPDAPSGLNASPNGSDIIFKWNKSTDAETPNNGLTYNLYIGTDPDSTQIMSPMADISTGFRRVVQMGNCNHDTCWTIKNLPAGTYYWSVQTIDNCFAGSAWAPQQTFVHNPVSINEEKSLPTKYALDPNYPNPFNPMTTIRYALPWNGHVQLAIYNLNGQLIEKLIDENKVPGYYSVQWNAARYSSGVYFYKLNAGDYIEIRKCVLIK